MNTYDRLALEDALRHEFRKRFLTDSRLKIKGAKGVFIHQKKAREEATCLVDEELEVIQAAHAGHDPGKPVLPFPFTMEQWLQFAARYGVADLWTVSTFVVPTDGKPVSDQQGRPRKRVRQESIDAAGIKRLRLMSPPAAELVMALLDPPKDEPCGGAEGLPPMDQGKGREAEDDDGLTQRERQIRAIEQAAIELGFLPLQIPDGGKRKLMEHCKANRADLFGAGDDPFKGAWKAAGRRRLKMANHERYLRG
jgi:hypothetical protein